MTIINPKTKLYTRQGLWSLFLMCAFPIHFWTLILAFRDFSWLIDRSNLWDAVGVASYGMIFAFAESLIVFLIAIILGLLVSKYWDPPHRTALLSSLVLITALWAMANQLFALLSISPPTGFLNFFVQQSHPLRALYVVSLLLVSTTILIPTYLILKSDKALQFVLDFIDRITFLAAFYLFFDVIGLIIVIIRNV
jgi:hypothetical protein